MFCDTSREPETSPTTTGSTTETVEEDPEGQQVPESWMCDEGGYDSYVTTSDGRIFCTGGRTFVVEEDWQCTEGGGRVERAENGDLICYDE